MKRRLFTRFLLSFVAVALVATGITASISLGATSLFFRRYLSGSRTIRSQQVQTLLTVYYINSNSWHGIQEMLLRITRNDPRRRARGINSPMEMMAHEDRILLADQSGVIIGDSNGTRLGATLTAPERSQGTIIMVNGAPVGIMVLSSPIKPDLSSLEQYFRRSVLFAVIIAGLSGIILAFLLGLTLSRRIVVPISSLVQASKKIATKDFAQRIPVYSDDEIGNLANNFNLMAEELQKTEGLRQDLLSDVAHELRTPLTILRANLEAIQEEIVPLTPETIASLNDEVLRMSRLVNDLQDLNLTEAGRLPLHKADTDMEALLNRIISSMSIEAFSKQQSVETDIANLPAAFIDPDRISQVFMNLLGNAIRYSPVGAKIRVLAKPVEAAIQVLVENTGASISPDELTGIFERFYRGEKSRSRAYGGSGLGLAIAKGLVETHGGKIWAEHFEGVTRFGFTVPVHSSR